jgi:hypothetical protein
LKNIYISSFRVVFKHKLLTHTPKNFDLFVEMSTIMSNWSDERMR